MKHIVAFLIAIVMNPVSHSHAASYIATYSGFMASGQDKSGEFGQSLADLKGLVFKAAFVFDTQHPNATKTDDGTSRSIYGGQFHGNTSPVKGYLTVNGVTVVIGGDPLTFGEIYQTNDFSGFDFVYATVYRYNPHLFNEYAGMNASIFNYDTLMVATQDFTQSIAYDVQKGDKPRGSFWISSGSRPGDPIRDAFGQFDIRTFTIAPSGLSAVPEPATWMMMISGFFAMSAALRAKRRPRVTRPQEA